MLLFQHICNRSVNECTSQHPKHPLTSDTNAAGASSCSPSQTLGVTGLHTSERVLLFFGGLWVMMCAVHMRKRPRMGQSHIVITQPNRRNTDYSHRCAQNSAKNNHTVSPDAPGRQCTEKRVDASFIIISVLYQPMSKVCFTVGLSTLKGRALMHAQKHFYVRAP